MVFVMPPIQPVKRTGPALAMADRTRLATVLAEAPSLLEAARRYGVEKDRLVTLANREGFRSLLTRLRHPLTTAMQDPVKRERLMLMIRDGVKAQAIANEFHLTRSALWAFFYRTGLDHAYLKATKQRGRRRQLAQVPGRDPQLIETFRIAAMLAGRGITVEGVPVYTGSRLTGCRLKADGAPVKIHYIEVKDGERTYHRVTPSLSDHWYLIVTPRRQLIALAPPHDGSQRFIPVADPAKIMESRTPPRFFWKPSEWPTPKSLAFKPIRKPSVRKAA